jgi:hypothetical protein
LFELLRKDSAFNWTEAHQKVFDELKEAFCSAPILKHFNPELETILETDSSDFAAAAVLSQKHPDPITENSVLHPVAYYSRKLTPAECNYGIGDKELLAIILAFEEWRIYIHGLGVPVVVLTDHNNLQTFLTKKLLNRRQARWALQLAEYNFKIVYRPGKQNGKADALTRRSGDLPEEGDGRGRPIEAVLRPQNFGNDYQLCALAQAFKKPIATATKTDPFAQSIVEALKKKETRHPKVSLSECSYVDKILLVNDLVYVPDKKELQCQIIRSSHDHPAAGHPGRAATFELVSRNYWWPGLRKTIAQYIRNCDTCARIKPVRHAPFGYLKPLEIPQRRWSSVSIDLIVGLPDSNGFDAVLVVVDRLSKMAHFLPCRSDIDSEGIASLFRDGVFKHHGLSDDIVSDRGTIFKSQFMRALCKLVGIKQKFSTAFHPQTDGQTERVNALLEQYLRGYCNYQQDDWSNLLTMAEFAYNNTISSTTRMTPFFANYGYHPRYEILTRPGAQPTPQQVVDYSEQMRKLDSHLQAEMKYAQAAQSEQANRHRIPSPVLNVGDKVWLLRRHIQTSRPSSKLDFKRLGKFKIIEKVSSHAYKLELPASMKIHPVFHVSLLEPAAKDPLPGQVQPPPPPIIVDGEEHYEVEEILDSRRNRGRIEYRIRWAGYDEETWEPKEYAFDVPDLVERFHRRYPRKPKPASFPWSE